MLVMKHMVHFDGLVQERHNSSVWAMELRLSCIDLLGIEFKIIL